MKIHDVRVVGAGEPTPAAGAEGRIYRTHLTAGRGGSTRGAAGRRDDHLVLAHRLVPAPRQRPDGLYERYPHPSAADEEPWRPSRPHAARVATGCVVVPI